MEKDLDLLEGKVQQLVALCRNLRQENARLRADLNIARDEHQHMGVRMTEARQRLEVLLQQIPETE